VEKLTKFPVLFQVRFGVPMTVTRGCQQLRGVPKQLSAYMS
jgi:hypothetical protein